MIERPRQLRRHQDGKHDGIGYFLDSTALRQERSRAFPLAARPIDRIVEALIPS